MSPPDEVFTAIPASDALRQAEILAMRQLSDNVGQLNRSVGELSKDMRDVRDKVIAIEAQELKAAILQVKGDVMDAVRGVRDDHEKRIAEVCKDVERVEAETVNERRRIEGRVNDNALAIARLRGTILPLASLGSAILAAILSVIVDLLIKGHVGP